MIAVRLISRPQFLDPGDLEPREDQLQGTDGERLIEVAGRVCYDSFGVGRSSEDYHGHVLDVGHTSIAEHAQYGFRIRGASRNLLQELARHRVGIAISVRSTRYVDETGSEVVAHPALLGVCDSPDSFAASADIDRALASCEVAYRSVVELVERDMIANGVDKFSARKQARAAGRQYLPGGLETEIIWSANVRALRHVIDMRASNPADAEIRVLGVALLAIMSSECPAYFADYRLVRAADGLGMVATRERPATPAPRDITVSRYDGTLRQRVYLVDLVNDDWVTEQSSALRMDATNAIEVLTHLMRTDQSIKIHRGES